MDLMVLRAIGGDRGDNGDPAQNELGEFHPWDCHSSIRLIVSMRLLILSFSWRFAHLPLLFFAFIQKWAHHPNILLIRNVDAWFWWHKTWISATKCSGNRRRWWLTLRTLQKCRSFNSALNHISRDNNGWWLFRCVGRQQIKLNVSWLSRFNVLVIVPMPDHHHHRHRPQPFSNKSLFPFSSSTLSHFCYIFCCDDLRQGWLIKLSTPNYFTINIFTFIKVSGMCSSRSARFFSSSPFVVGGLMSFRLSRFFFLSYAATAVTVLCMFFIGWLLLFASCVELTPMKNRLT